MRAEISACAWDGDFAFNASSANEVSGVADTGGQELTKFVKHLTR